MYLNINSRCSTFYDAVVPLKISAESVEDLFINHCSYCGDEGEEVLNAILRAKNGDEVSPFEVWMMAGVLEDCFNFGSQNVLTINAFEDVDDAEAKVVDDDGNSISFSIGDLEDDTLDDNAIPNDTFEYLQMAGFYIHDSTFDKNYFSLEEDLNNKNKSIEEYIKQRGLNSVREFFIDDELSIEKPLDPGIYCGLFERSDYDCFQNLEFEIDGKFDFSKLKKISFYNS